MTSAVLTLPPADSLFAKGRAGACAGAIALVSVLAFEAMAVAAAMPAIAIALDGLDSYALAFGGMLATAMLGMVLAGRWCDARGPAHAAAGGLALFAAGLLLAGCADGMRWLVAGRVVQGLGSGMLGVALYVGMGQLVPPPLHPRLFAMFSAAWVLPGLLGPVVAAWLVHHVGWRAVFLLAAAAVPVAALLLLPAFQRLAPPARRAAEPATRIAWAVLAAAGALVLNSAGRPGMALPLMSVGLAATLLAAGRLLPTGTLRAHGRLQAVIALRGLIGAAFGTAEVFVPLYLTREAGWTLIEAGMALSTGAVLWSLGSAIQSRLASPGHRRRGLQAGFLSVSVGIGLVALRLLLPLPPWASIAAWALAGLGVGLGLPMLSVLTLSLSQADEQGRNASALQLSDALCTSASLAVAGALFAFVGTNGPWGYFVVLGFAAGLALLGAALAARAFASAGPAASQPNN